MAPRKPRSKLEIFLIVAVLSTAVGACLWVLGKQRAGVAAHSIALARHEHIVSAPVETLTRHTPWAVGHRRLAAREYAPLVANARKDPAAGTYGLAVQALQHCIPVLEADFVARMTSLIAAGPADKREIRHASMERLRAPCLGLGDPDALRRERDLLYEEGMQRGDAYLRLRASGSFLLDKRVERAARQDRVRELMEMSDPMAMRQALNGIQGEGASLDGQTLTRFEALPYGIAWFHVMCDTFGECRGPESTLWLGDCMRHGECGQTDMNAAIAGLVPWFMPEKVPGYYRRIQAHLDRRRFDAFGVP